MQRSAKDLTGLLVGRLRVIERAPTESGRTRWRCACACGGEAIVSTNNLTRGAIKSCGCLRREASARCDRRLIDMTGQRFGRVTVLHRGTRAHLTNAQGQVVWVVRCDCDPNGERTWAVAGANLRCGLVQSCGCLHREKASQASRVHGETRTSEHGVWQAMITRCENPNVQGFENYGGRGIRVCDRWRNDFAAFLADMGRRPSPTHSIDRIDVNGNYEPSNCRWATKKEQARNKRNNRLITINGETRCVAEWAERLGCKPAVVVYRYGRSIVPATTPVAAPSLPFTPPAPLSWRDRMNLARILDVAV